MKRLGIRLFVWSSYVALDFSIWLKRKMGA